MGRSGAEEGWGRIRVVCVRLAGLFILGFFFHPSFFSILCSSAAIARPSLQSSCAKRLFSLKKAVYFIGYGWKPSECTNSLSRSFVAGAGMQPLSTRPYAFGPRLNRTAERIWLWALLLRNYYSFLVGREPKKKFYPNLLEPTGEQNFFYKLSMRSKGTWNGFVFIKQYLQNPRRCFGCCSQLNNENHLMFFNDEKLYNTMKVIWKMIFNVLASVGSAFESFSFKSFPANNYRSA